MRRKDKEITDPEELEEILSKTKVCRVAFRGEEFPYLVPLNYGYKDRCLYIHSAREGYKIDLLRKEEKVCFQVDVDVKMGDGRNPCDTGMRYRSVIGFGMARLVSDPAEKLKALEILIEQCLGRGYALKPGSESDVEVIRIEIVRMTGKKSEG